MGVVQVIDGQLQIEASSSFHGQIVLNGTSQIQYLGSQATHVLQSTTEVHMDKG